MIKNFEKTEYDGELLYDVYDKEIRDGQWYLENNEGIYSQETLNGLYKEYEDQSVYRYIEEVYGKDFVYPTGKEDREYYEDCFINGDLYALFDSLTM